MPPSQILSPKGFLLYLTRNQAGTDNEYKLFQVFERFFLATQEIVFPRPSGEQAC